MKRSSRMEVVERVIRQQEDRAAAALGLAQTQVKQEQQKLQELHDYLNSYENDMLSKGGQGISGQQWQNFQYFLGQLEQVIGQQQHTIVVAEQQLEKIRLQWQQIHIKRKSIASLVENIRFEEWMVEEKREQKALDELVSQLQARR